MSRSEPESRNEFAARLAPYLLRGPIVNYRKTKSGSALTVA